jgi:predicted transcriptional regulator
MLLSDIQQALEATVLSGHSRLNISPDQVIISDILSDVMTKAGKGSLWVTNQTNINVVAISFFKGLAGVVLPDHLQLDRDALARAMEKEIPVLSSALTTFNVAGVLHRLGLKG